MKYKTLIKRFEKFADCEVDVIAKKGEVSFFPVGDEYTEIVHLIEGEKKPFKAKEIKG